MTRGTVKWFNNVKGYGFIIPETGGGDVFAHYSTIEMEGYKTLRAGQQVQFEAVEGPNGMQTSQVKSLDNMIDGAPNRNSYNNHHRHNSHNHNNHNHHNSHHHHPSAGTNFPMK